MKKNLILLTILLLLLGFGLWQWSLKTNDTFGTTEHTQFAVKDTSEVGRIFIVDRNNTQADLRREADGLWYFYSKKNNRTYLANEGVMNILLQTITNIRTRIAVAKRAVDHTVKSIASTGKKVEIYDKKGNILKVYYVGGSADEGKGTHMIMEGSNMPYIVYYPKWQGTLDTRYTVDEMTWRDRAVFRVNPSDLEFVEVKYFDKSQEDASFRIERKGADTYEVQPVYPSTPVAKTAFNQINAAAYMEDFKALVGESIVKEQAILDTIPNMPIFATITYKTKLHNQPQTFNVRPIFNPTADRGDGTEGTRQRIQRYIMDLPNGDAFISQHLVARKLFWSYKFFFQQEEVNIIEDEAIFIQKSNLPIVKDTTKKNFPYTPNILDK